VRLAALLCGFTLAWARSSEAQLEDAVERAAPRAKPTVASINLCADQWVLSLADPEQILTVSWLSADAEESMLAERAAGFPLNYGSAEELLRYDPDIVIAGTFTSDFTRALLTRLGYAVLALAPETSIADIEINLRRVAQALDQVARGETVLRRMRERTIELELRRPAEPVPAVVVRPGGFTVGRASLADELLRLTGLRNVAAEQGLDRWGSLSMETLLRSAPELLVMTGYRADQPSLANAVLAHPALRHLQAEIDAVAVPAAYWACGLPQSLESAALIRSAMTP
jgi:iron complex transport system substrate-binding protein